MKDNKRQTTQSSETGSRQSEAGIKGERPRKQLLFRKQANGMQSQSQSQSQSHPEGAVTDRILRSVITTKPCRFHCTPIAISKPVCKRETCIRNYQKDFLQKAAQPKTAKRKKMAKWRRA